MPYGSTAALYGGNSAINEESVISQELNPDRLICPVCGCRVVIPGSKAGDRYGVCGVCFTRAKAAAKKYELEMSAAQREYDMSRQQIRRAKNEALKQGKKINVKKADPADFLG